MRKMENRITYLVSFNAEKFKEEPDNPIVYHIIRIYLPICSAFKDFGHIISYIRQIGCQLYLADWPFIRSTEKWNTIATSFNEAIEPSANCTHYHTNGADIKQQFPIGFK